MEKCDNVSVKEDGELFATEVVCDVAEGEQRRWLSNENDNFFYDESAKKDEATPVVGSAKTDTYNML